MEILNLKVGTFHTPESFEKELVSLGYHKSHEGDIEPGYFRRVGGLISLSASNQSEQLSFDFFGNELEQIKGQSSKKKYDEVVIEPNKLSLPDGTVLIPGDYVVHEDHGVGLFESLETKIVSDQKIRYVRLLYLNNDRLFLPEGMRDKLSRYIGVGRRRPKLNKLGSPTWQKTYKKTYESVLALARELLEIYAKREVSKKKPMTINREWLFEIEKTFGYDLTPDQNLALADTLSDLQSRKLLDRLICGDVGLGKTEIAIRASAVAVSNGFQIAVLVPTTILAEQHYINFKNRFAKLPITIERLSRLVTSQESDRIVEGLENGTVDLVVGTHKLLSNSLKFKNLGLIVIDEEQKFGVKQKEYLKQMKAEVNVLTLTATPIPRTLFMALSGIRDVSNIKSVPLGRKAVETKVVKYAEDSIVASIENELKREGQVYYLHNRVSTMAPVYRWLNEKFPDKNIAIGHGQMGEDQLARVMADFANKKIDVLLCSTIIENGLDLPNVNTLIVDESDKFGLSQLHQIRGRIGRSDRQAYAIFTYKDKKISQNAVKRLKAIAEYSELGAGYDISLSDLEIRGGGNILGKEQHGSMEAVGLVLYSKLLSAAIKKLKEGQVGGIIGS